MSKKREVVVLGDSFNNTLGLIRSLGECGAHVILILVGTDRLFVSKSKYLKQTIRCNSLDQCQDILLDLGSKNSGNYLIATNDKAAKWIDDREKELSQYFLTPMRGKQLGNLFNKPEQCKVAQKFNITIPTSFVYKRKDTFSTNINYPILLKPANSNSGEKSDIHICRDLEDINTALSKDSKCETFICQEYIEKEYEINMLGISTDNGVFIPGGIRKIRHYPDIYSPCSFGQFQSASSLNIDVRPLTEMIQSIGYKGPFSIEFLRKSGKNYFMEINFRNDGLAYAATVAGANLPEMYINGEIENCKVSPIYMMDLSIDYCHVQDGNITKADWIKDFFKTTCQLNFNKRDFKPTFFFYLNKIRNKI